MLCLPIKTHVIPFLLTVFHPISFLSSFPLLFHHFSADLFYISQYYSSEYEAQICSTLEIVPVSIMSLSDLVK